MNIVGSLILIISVKEDGRVSRCNQRELGGSELGALPGAMTDGGYQNCLLG